MQLLLIDREFPPNPHGGIGTYNLSLAKRMGQLGHYVVVLSCTSDTRPIVTDEPYGMLYRVPYRRRIGLVSRYLRWIDQFSFGLSIVPYALQFAERFEVDVIELPSAGGYGCFLARRLKGETPVVTRFHGSLGKIPIDDTARSALRVEMRRMGYDAVRRGLAQFLNIPLWPLERTQIVQSTQVTCPSEFSRSWLSRQIGPVGFSYPVIPNGLHVDRSLLRGGTHADTQPLREKIVMFIGRCSVSKGVTVLARAIPRILTKDPDVAFVFAGPLVDLRVARVLSGLAERHPGRVRILGRIPHEQVLRLLLDSYLLVTPSFYETSSLVIMEAMALGVPVVASSMGPFPEIVEDGVSGLLFPVGDEEALARSVLTLLNAGDAWLEMGKACRSRFAALFRMEIVVQQLADLYEEIVGARCGNSSA